MLGVLNWQIWLKSKESGQEKEKQKQKREKDASEMPVGE